MANKSEVQVGHNVRPYLDEIAERLWTGHAAIMVGAGFSKNAECISTSSSDFPDWGQLGDLFFEKTKGEKLGAAKYLNVLKLADEVQAALGRPALDQLLRSNIPDKDYAPSPLHIKLLELPWADVLTTNYDTLLERASESIASRKYDVVVNKEDLVYSEKPRIIKLHGSFPSERPFIITEEDYRRYPKDFAPFVNTVQQALLENTLCLVGFSGDDPNFLQWIGWIRDNLGKENAPKIYLVGIFGLSDAQKKLLEQRNIILVDLEGSPDIDDDPHYKALERFCDYLQSKKEEDNRLGWPGKSTFLHPNRDADNKEKQIVTLIDEWKTQRQSYPGWVVLPDEPRNLLWRYTEAWVNFISPEDNLPAPILYAYTYELIWRLERCLCPIFDNIAELAELTAKALSPSHTNSLDQEDRSNNLTLGDSKKIWVSIQLSMLRFYREEGKIEKWIAIDKALSENERLLQPAQLAALHYERCMHALFELDPKTVIRLLNEWPENDALPFWKAKRAGLLAEIGQVKEADELLKQALNEIRSKLNLTPVSKDYSLISQEAYTLFLLQQVNSSIAFSQNTWGEHEQLREEMTERFKVLKQYQCDPWNELRLLEVNQSLPVYKEKDTTEKSEFEIGSVTRTRHFGRSNKGALTAYRFLRLCEDAGIPFRTSRVDIKKKAAEGTLAHISQSSPYWALSTMIRIGDSKVVDQIFNRESMQKIPPQEADSLIVRYLDALERCSSHIQEGDPFRNENFGNILAETIPEVLSRLCCKCSKNSKDRLLAFLLAIFQSDQRPKYRGIKNLSSRLLESYSDQQQLEVIPTLLTFPVVTDGNFIVGSEFTNPFHFLRELEGYEIKASLNEAQISGLLTQAISSNPENRKWAIFALIRLYQIGLLGTEWENRLAEALWSQLDKFGLPAHIEFYKFAFLSLPYPESVDPEALIKGFIQQASFPVESDKGGVSMTGGRVPICNEIVGASKHIAWDKDEVLSLLNRMTEWWNTDKGLLLRNREVPFFSDIPDEIKARFSRLVEALTAIAPSVQISSDEELVTKAGALIHDLSKHGIPSLQAQSAFLPLFTDSNTEVLRAVHNALASSQADEITDALRSILVLLNMPSGVIAKAESSSLLNALGQIVLWRRKESLVSAIRTIEVMIHDHPKSFVKDLTDSTLLGLEYLISDTDLEGESESFDFSEKLKVRQASASLAYTIYHHYQGQSKPIPEVLMKWQHICASENEFAEIRNQWRLHS